MSMQSNQQQTISQYKSHINPKYSTQSNQPSKQAQVDKLTSNKNTPLKLFKKTTLLPKSHQPETYQNSQLTTNHQFPKQNITRNRYVNPNKKHNITKPN